MYNIRDMIDRTTAVGVIQSKSQNKSRRTFTSLASRAGKDELLTKLDRIAEILKRPEAMAMQKEYRLFVHLLVVSDGSLVGDPEMIGRELSTDWRNIKGWLGKLSGAGIVTVTELQHRQRKIELKEPYLSVAEMQEDTSEPNESPVREDPELKKLIAVYNTAKATGQEIRVNTEFVIRHE